MAERGSFDFSRSINFAADGGGGGGGDIKKDVKRINSISNSSGRVEGHGRYKKQRPVKSADTSDLNFLNILQNLINLTGVDPRKNNNNQGGSGSDNA